MRGLKERMRGKIEEVIISLSFVLNSHLIVKRKEKMNDVRTCNPAKWHTLFWNGRFYLKAKVNVDRTSCAINTFEKLQWHYAYVLSSFF